MTGIQATDQKKKADDELQVVVDELKAIDEDLNTRLDNIKKMLLIKRLIIQLFDSFTLELFAAQIKSYKIVFEEISHIITEGKDKKESNSEIISKLTKINLSVEPNDKKVKKQIERSNTLEKLHLSAGKSAAELKLIINDCRKNTVEEHNRELVEQVRLRNEEIQLLKEKDAEKDQEIQSLSKEVQELKTENADMKAQVRLLVQQMSDVQGILAAMMSQNQASWFQSINSPSSSLSDSGIEIINMPNGKYH